MSDDTVTTLASAHRELLDKRVRLAILIGIPAYVLDVIEPWFEFHDPKAVFVQLGAAFLMCCLGGLALTHLCTHYRFTIFTMGYFVGVGGFSAVVSYERAFGTSYSAGFAVLFAFYCVFIPTTVLRTALVGLIVAAILSVPEMLITEDVSRLGTAAISDLIGFVVLLFGRHIANDLWEREFLARAQIESSYKQLVQSEKMAALGRLAAGVAHELNNPLAIIASNVESIERLLAKLFSGKAPEEVAAKASLFRAVQRLRVGTERLSSVNGLLREYVSPSHGHMVPSNINRQIDVALALVEPKVSTKGVTIHRATNHDVMLLCDPQALSHVFVNLLENACDAVEPGGNIWLRCDIKADGALDLSVRDDGPGMAESLRTRIGEPFVTTKEPAQGLGLGLALCKSIIEKHSGEMVLSNRDPGLEAVITFPPTSLSRDPSSCETVPHG